MKKGLTKKLLLSAVTLGLAVASLGTTTYAWFTMNTTASAEAVGGSTQEDEGNFFVSTDGTNWGTTISIPALASLKPVTFDDSGAAKVLTSNTELGNAVASGASAVEGGNYYSFSIYFRSSMAGNVTATPAWTSEGMAAFNPLTTTDDLTQGTTVSVDILSALRIQTKIGDANATKYTVAKQQTGAHDDFGTALTTGTAAKYYEALIGKFSDDVKATCQDETGIADYTTETYSLEANTTLEVQYTIWLEGWDADCFNAILAQEFGLSYVFTFAA